MSKKLLELYWEEWRFFRTELARSFILMSVFYVVVTVILLVFFVIQPNAAQKAVSDLYARITPEHFTSPIALLIDTISHNLLIAFSILLLGLIPFFLFSMLPLSLSCYFFAALIYVSSNVSFLTFIAAVLPHGMIEIPAIIYATCLGVQLSRSRARNRNGMMTIDANPNEHVGTLHFPRTLKNYALVVMPLIVLAAFIETYLTPLFIAAATR